MQTKGMVGSGDMQGAMVVTRFGSVQCAFLTNRSVQFYELKRFEMVPNRFFSENIQTVGNPSRNEDT